MENNDVLEDKMIDYAKQWSRLSVSIPFIDDNWLEEMIIKKCFISENILDHQPVLKQEYGKFINRFKNFNKKRIRLKDDWLLEVRRETMRRKNQLNGNFTENENYVSPNNISAPIENPLERLSGLICNDGEDLCKCESVITKPNVNSLPTFYDLGKLCPELKKDFFRNTNDFNNKENDKEYASLWDLAVNIAYDESNELESITEWRIKIRNQSSFEYNACHRINTALNDADIILKNLLMEMGIEFTGSFWKNIDRSDMKKPPKLVQDIYYLLELIVKFKQDNRRNWDDYDNKNSFGRSFLKDGKGGLGFFLKKNLRDRCGWTNTINQDYSIIGLLSSLFVMPKLLEAELYWQSIDSRKFYDVKFEFVVKQILLENFPVKIISEKRLRNVRSFEKNDYSLIDDVYWFISIRQLKDFFAIGEIDDQGLWDEFDIDAIALLDIIEKADNSGKNIDKEQHIRGICVEYLSKKGCTKKKESLDRKMRRVEKLYSQLYDFYEKGMNVFRDLEIYEWIFDRTQFVNAMRNGQDKISKIRKAYFKSVIIIIYLAIEKKKIFPKSLNGKVLEEKCSLAHFISLYEKEIDKIEFLKNPTAHLIWEFLNDRIEWGEGAKKVNGIRQTMIVPYLLNYTGLRNNNSDEKSFNFNEVIAKILPEHNIDFLDMQISQVHQRYNEIFTRSMLERILMATEANNKKYE